MSDVYGCPFHGQWLCHEFDETDEEVGITFEPYKKQCLLESISKKAANLNLPCEIRELWSDAYAKCHVLAETRNVPRQRLLATYRF